MNFAKIILVLFFLTRIALGEGVPFSVSSAALPPQAPPTPGAAATDKSGSDTQTTVISDLKYQAVVDWLQGYLGPRYANFDKYVTPEFAEKYILDYKVSRSALPAGTIELSGHLDGDALRRWTRLVESKSHGSNQIRPLLILSSNLPALSIAPAETALRLKDSSTAQLIAQMVNQQFQKLNTHTNPVENPFSLDAPPKNDSEMKTLRSAASRNNENTAIWVALSACSSCGGARIDIFFYSLPTLRLVSVVGDDISVSQRDFNNTETLKRLFAPVFQQFHTELENAVSEGNLFDNAFHLLIESVESYRLLKAIEAEMAHVDFMSPPIFKRAESRAAEYEVLTPLSTEELTRRIQTLEVSGYKPKVTRVEGSTLVLRYLR